jgi:CRP-like cAMP-binding protein
MAELEFESLQLFTGLQPEQMNILRPLFTGIDLEADDVVFEQGELADGLYVLVSGELNILYKPDDGPELVIARVRPETVIGWSAALGTPLYTSSAVCLTNCCLLRLRGEDLRWLCEKYPALGVALVERLAAALANRLNRNYRQVVSLLQQGLRINIRKTVTIKPSQKPVQQ